MDAIGDEPLWLDGPPDLLRSRLEAVTRPGVNGTGFFDVGVRGQPQTLRSRNAYADLQSAVDAFARYSALVDEDPVSIVFGEVDFAAYGVRYQVVDVRPVSVRSLAASCDGNLGWLEAEWSVVPVPIPAEE